MTPSDSTSRRLRDLSPRGLAMLVAITAAGAVLRIAYQIDRPFTDDEVGTLQYLALDYGHLLTMFYDWLTMNYYIALVKWVGSFCDNAPWALVAPSLIAGVVTIPLVAAAALRVSGVATALVAAALIAFNPYLVFYSVQIRSYMLLAAFAITALVWLLDWMHHPRWRSGVGCALCCALAMLMHPNAVYHVAFLACWYGIWRFSRGRSCDLATACRRCASLIVPMIACGILVAAAYLPLLKPIAEFRAMFNAEAPTPVNYLHLVSGLYFVHGFAVVPTLVLLVIGLWLSVRDRTPVLYLALGVVIPIVCASWLGVSQFPWTMGRYFIAVVPLLIVIVASAIALPAGRQRTDVVVVLTILVAATWTPNLRAIFVHKYDYPWQDIAAYLNDEVGRSDHILAIEHRRQHPALNLVPYLDRRTVSVGAYLDGAEQKQQLQRLFVVSADAPIESAKDYRNFGVVQVVIYTGDRRSQIARQLLADLRTSLNNRVAAHLTGQYNLLLKQMHALDDGTEWRKYTALYYKCLMRTRRQRHSPSQILNLLPRDQVLTILP